MGRAIAHRTDLVTARIEEIARYKSRSEPERPGRLGKKHRKIATGATAPVQRLKRSLRAFRLAALVNDLCRNAIRDVFQEGERDDGCRDP